MNWHFSDHIGHALERADDAIPVRPMEDAR
jgi:hypothetical protein